MHLSPAPVSPLPALAGVGLKAAHYSAFLEAARRGESPAWVEVHPQNYFCAGGPTLRWAAPSDAGTAESWSRPGRAALARVLAPGGTSVNLLIGTSEGVVVGGPSGQVNGGACARRND